jgi:3-hydroxybutyryl-CoA dehydratase
MKEYTWSDLHIGLKEEFEATFATKDAVTFAALSGDENPLHTDKPYAMNAGFSRPVLFGMLTSSLYSRLVGVYLPGKFALLQGIDIDFSSPCFAGDRLNVTGEIVYMNEAYRRFEIKASIRKDDQELVSKATIRVGFHAS